MEIPQLILVEIRGTVVWLKVEKELQSFGGTEKEWD